MSDSFHLFKCELTSFRVRTFGFQIVLQQKEFLKRIILYSSLNLNSYCCSPFLQQAQARCHRIGQNKAVKVYRLITRNSYEREMFDRASLKLGLDKAVLQSMSGRENSVGGVCKLPS